jgi:CheY-like chemotaxis protein
MIPVCNSTDKRGKDLKMNTGGEKILIVDDDSIRDIVSKMLCWLGYAVLSADSGEKGLVLFL